MTFILGRFHHSSAAEGTVSNKHAVHQITCVFVGKNEKEAINWLTDPPAAIIKHIVKYPAPDTLNNKKKNGGKIQLYEAKIGHNYC